MNCIQLNDKQVEELNKALKSKLEKEIKNLGLKSEYKDSKLTKEEAIAVFSEYATTQGITAEKLGDLFSTKNFRIVLDLINKGRTKKMQEQALIKQQKEQDKKEREKMHKIGGAELDTYDIFAKKTASQQLVNDKGTVPRNKDTLFIFNGNLQAVNATSEEKIGDTIDVKTGVQLDVKTGPAMMRTNTNKDINENAIELVISKNQQDSEGHFITENFKNTEEDKKAFIEANKRAIERIKQLIDPENGTYKKINFPKDLIIGKQQLPEEFIDILQNMLQEELGLVTSKYARIDGTMGLHVVKLDKQEKDALLVVLKEKSEKLNDALESLQAKQPTLSDIVVDPEDRYILSVIYPNIEQRLSRINYISTFFSQVLNNTLEDTVSRLREKQKKGELSTENEAILEGLTAGNKKDQKIFFIKTYGNGEFIQSIIEGMKAFIDRWAVADDYIEADGKRVLTDKGQKAYKEIYETLLGKQNKDLGLYKNFMDIMAQRGIEKTEEIKKNAATFAANIAHSYKVMSDEKVFKALVTEASGTIAFNEDIRFNFNNDVIEQTENEILEDPNMQEGEKENANREGYMVKYKLLDPEKTLSLNIKTLLGSLFKRNDKTGGHVYDDLLQPLRMNPLIAYEIIQENFAQMKSPDDFVKVLDDTISKYPWLYELRDKIVYNPLNSKEYMGEDIRNEFFSCLRKTKIPYAMVTARGLIKYLSSDTSTVAILRNVKNNIEGNLVLGSLSIYDDTGQLNMANVATLNRLFITRFSNREKIEGENGNEKHDKNLRFFVNRQKSPVGWCKNVIQQYINGKGKAVEVIQAIKLLSDTNAIYSLESLLKDVGINTNEVNVDTLFGDLKFFMNSEVTVDKDSLEERTHVTMNEINNRLPIERARDIYNILYSIDTIINQDKLLGLSSTSQLTDRMQSQYLVIGKSISQTSEGFSGMTFRFGDKTMATYAAPDFISDLVANINNMNREEAEAYIEKNYGQYDFFKNQQTKKWLNKWLENFFYENKDPNTEAERFPFRRAFKYLNILSLLGSEDINSIQKIDKNTLKKGLVYAFYSANNTADKQMAYYRIPSLSDVDALVMLQGEAYKGKNYQEQILDLLVGVIRQEWDRIIANRIGEQKILVEHYNSGRNNADKFNYLTFLNTPEYANRVKEILRVKTEETETNTEYNQRVDKELKELIRDKIAQKAQAFIDSFNDEEKLRMHSVLNGETTQKQIQEEVNLALNDNKNTHDTEAVREAERKKKIEAVNDKLRMFYYNDYFAASQIQQLLGGDLAYYKNYRDFIKRNKQAYACGERIFARTTDEFGNITGEMTEKAIYLEDENVIATSYENLKNMLQQSNIPGLDQAQIKFILGTYTKICATDGQSYRSLDSLKRIFKAKGGKWTEDMEVAFQHIKKGDILTAQDFKAFWNSIKPFYFGNETQTVNGRREKIPTQHKNSEYLITALFSVLNTALQRSPKLLGLQKFMVENNIDVVHFHSVVKEGYNSPFSLEYNQKLYEADRANNKISILGQTFTGTYELYYKTIKEALINGTITQQEFDEAYNRYQYNSEKDVFDSLQGQLLNMNATLGENVAIKEFSLDNYMFVQPSDDHLIDQEAIFGSQLRNIIMADLPSTFGIDITIDGKVKHLNREEAIQFYNTLLVDTMLDAFKSLSSEFKDVYSLQRLLFRNMEGNERYGKDVRDALQIDPKTKTFTLPFNSPTLSNKIEALILSTFKNEIQRQKISGGSAVLVSNFGLSDDLHVNYIKDKDGKEHAKSIEAYLPAAYSDLYKDFLVPHGDVLILDFEKMKESLGEKAKDLLNIIGYRIPTEDKYSIIPIEVKGFLPVSVGTTVMLPAEIINMSGTDFDIDKLFLMLKEYTRYKYKQNLGIKYEQYLREQHISFDESLAYSNLKKSDASKGFTEKKINALRDKDEYFDDFMEEEGNSLVFDTPQYDFTSLKTKDKEGNELSLSEMSRQSSRAARNNALIDIIYKTLTSPEGSILNMQVGNFKSLEEASRQQWILKNPEALKALRTIYGGDVDSSEFNYYEALKSMSKDKIEKFMEDYTEPDDPNDIMFYADTHRNLMDGNSLIGIFAVNSSDHYKLQNCDITIDPKYQFTLDTSLDGSSNSTLVDRIDTIYSLFNTNVRTGAICAEYQAAAPDNGKNPCLGDVGANERTTPIIGFLSRIGLDTHSTAILVNSEDLFKFAENVFSFKKQNANVKANTRYKNSIKEITNWQARYREDPEKFEREVKDDDNLQEGLMQFYYMMKRIKALGDALNKTTAISRSDSVNGALKVSVPEVLQQEKAIRNFAYFAQNDSPIKGLETLVDDTLGNSKDLEDLNDLRERILASPVPRLQAAYTFGIEAAKVLIGDYLPALNDTTRMGADYLCYAIKKSLTGKKQTIIWRKYITELTQAIISRDELFGDDDTQTEMEKRNYYIHDFPMKFKEMKEAVNEDGTPKYPEIANLTIIKYLSNRDGKGIKFTNISGTNDRTRLMYTQELETLLTSKNEEVRRFALDLFMYSYYDNGFAFSHNNFSILFTTLYFKNMKGLVQQLRDYSNKDKLFSIERFTRQFLINHPKLIPQVDETKLIYSKDKKTLTVDEKNKYILWGKTEELVMLKQQLGEEEVVLNYTFLPFIYTSEGIYYRDEINKNYKKLDIEEFPVTPYYDQSKEFYDIEWNKLKPRGTVAGIKATIQQGEKNSKAEQKAKKKKEKSEEDALTANIDDETLEDAATANIDDEVLEDAAVGNIEEEYLEDPEAGNIEEEEYEEYQPGDDEDMLGYQTVDDEEFEVSDQEEIDDSQELIDKYKETDDETNKLCH